ncbi:MAG: phosphatidate cytidylyltransferase [Kistimonas sp.]|nr:phosphatidate cytidylyltransferase [Kistimonas sp.]
MTALILSLLCIAAVVLLPMWWFELLAALIVVVLGAWEWARLAGFPAFWQRLCYTIASGLLLLWLHNAPELSALGQDIPVLLTLGVLWWCLALVLVLSYPASAGFWRCSWLRLLMGWLVLLPAWAGLVALAHLESAGGIADEGRVWLFYLFALVWGSDAGAYFAGKRFGKRRLSPQVSPGKTWEGVLGSMVVTGALATGVAWYADMPWPLWPILVAISWLICLVAVLGDLLESMFKREQGFKDSGSVLPGHGGLLDRIDSLTAAAPVFASLCLLLEAPCWSCIQ